MELGASERMYELASRECNELRGRVRELEAELELEDAVIEAAIAHRNAEAGIMHLICFSKLSNAVDALLAARAISKEDPSDH